MPTLNLTNAEKKQRTRLLEKREEVEKTISNTLKMINITREFEKSENKSSKYAYFTAIFYTIEIQIQNANLAKIILSDIKDKNDEDGDKLEINDEVYLYT